MQRDDSNHLGKVSVLKVDMDCFVDRKWLEDKVRSIVLVCRSHGITVLSVKKCLSRQHGFHLYIEIRPGVDAEVANELQWLLGDHCSRVDFNRARIRSGLKEWNKLFWEPGRKLVTIYRDLCSQDPQLSRRYLACQR